MGKPITLKSQSRAAAQTAGTLSGNGTAVDVTGRNHVLIAIGVTATGTAGRYTFEESPDGGINWSAVTAMRLTDGTSASVTNAGENGVTFFLQQNDGPRMIRARISTNWSTDSPLVNICSIT